MASRAEQKAAARAAREARQRELTSAQTKRMRIIWLGGLAAAAALAIVIIVVASSGGSGGPSVKLSKSSKAADVAIVDKELAGIPQSGNVLGNPAAKVTVTEWGDLVCPTCDAFALSSEAQFIADDVKTGKAKLVYRAFDTASSYANEGEYVTTQVAAKAAGLQNKAWYYILLDYQEQPQTINGTDAEDVPYVTPAYIQGLASQIKGLNLPAWNANLTNPTLIKAVKADGAAGTAAGVTGTPGVYVSGPGGNFRAQTLSYPTLAMLQSLVKQAS